MLGKRGTCWSNGVISLNQKNRYADCERVLDPVQNRQFLLDVVSLGNRSLLVLLRFEKILLVQKLLKDKERDLVEGNNFF
jgi:hypothetical protein